jgi:hypothetical protein
VGLLRNTAHNLEPWPDVCRIETLSSVGTLGKDPDDFQVCPFVFPHITMLIGTQKVTVFSPNGTYLAVAGSKEVRTSVTVF